MPISSLTPVFPSPEKSGELKEKAFDLTKKASSMLVYPSVTKPLSQLVRVMNCYYSNLIEGHDTYPHEVERALQNDLSNDSTMRDLQKEALAHIQVQTLIDTGNSPMPAMDASFLNWCHHEFYKDLPKSMLEITHPQTGKVIEIEPGKFRSRGVKVGNHIAPDFNKVTPMLNGLFDIYGRYRGDDRIIAIAAANHRVAWVHPFVDGNGRVVRLMAHAALKELDLNVGLWSPSRGLARSSQEYKRLLAHADQARQGSTSDGRGALSEESLINFCNYYLETCIDQVEFMSGLFDMDVLLKRIERYCFEEHQKSKLSPDAFALLREALYQGEFERGRVGHIIQGKSGVTARRVLKSLLDRGLLISYTPRGAVRLGLPISILGQWFPNLYPQNILS